MAFKIAQIGSDGHWNTVLDGIALLPDAQLIACAKGREGDTLDSVKKHAAFGAHTRIYGDYREMLDSEDIDLVGICRPYSLNVEASIAAARRGIDIASEKPVATTLADLDALETAVKDSGIRLTAMFGTRLSPAFRAAHNAVREGLIGEPILATAQKSYRFGTRADFFKRRETYGGTIPWVAIHAVDYTRWASGQEYAQVAALHGNLAHPDYPGCEDHGGLLFRFANGGTAAIHFDYLRPDTAPTHGDDRLRIAGSKGVIEVIHDRAHLIRSGEAPRDLPLGIEENFLVDLYAERAGKSPHIIGPDEAIHVTRICLYAREAADTGKVIGL